MKTLYILFIGLLVSGGVLAQSCLPEGIEFTTQAQIDSFQILYPNCMEIEGDVRIHGNDITNLNALSSITQINGLLLIGHYTGSSNLSLSSLGGLSNLTSVGKLIIGGGNDTLSDLTGLENVTSIGEGLTIAGNNAHKSIDQLTNITSINGN